MKTLSIALLCTVLSATASLACGPDTDCNIGERTYRIAMPDGHDGTTPVGAIIHAHGYRGTAQGVMNNKGLRKMASRLGVALIAPKSAGPDWVIPGAPRKTGNDGSTEFTYFDALIEDVAARFPVDQNRLMMSGFSAGGMMVWNLACHRGDKFAGFAPIAGTFWVGPPEECPSDPVSLIHVHGTTDTVVPLEGRPIADTSQGNVRFAVVRTARDGAFGEPVRTDIDDMACLRRTNLAGNVLELCLHPGGHSMKSKWLERAWREFEKTGAL